MRDVSISKPYPGVTAPKPIVPREPTQAMLDAGLIAANDHVTSARLADMWRAMHDAATKR